jgi:hypothetical protein
MKRRSPWMMYAGYLVSGGLFGFLWLILLMRDVNELERSSVFSLRFLSSILLFGLLAFLLSFIFLLITFGQFSTTREVWMGMTFALRFDADGAPDCPAGTCIVVYYTGSWL